jgi:hypothetical protein
MDNLALPHGLDRRLPSPRPLNARGRPEQKFLPENPA